MDLLSVKTWKPQRWAAEEQVHQHEDKLFLALTLLIGAVVGLAVAAFILVTENLGSRMYPAGGAAWRRVLIPTLGSLITGILLFRYFPGARGSGIPQTKAALFLRDGVIQFRTILGRFGLSSISLASGIALGREGPSVQVGAGIASLLGRWLGLGPSRVKALIPIGAAAALAAAFNTPVAAVLFTLEEVMGDMHAPVLGSIVLSSATSWIVMHLVLGDEPLFHVPAYQLVHPAEFLAYAALGVVGGLVSVVFVKLLLFIRQWFLKLPKSTVWFQPVAGGLIVGVLGWFFPDVLGVGYAHVGQALNGQIAITAMVLLVVLKIVATSTCYASGNAGGIFGPSLFIGAMMGGALGSGLHSLFPDYTGSAGAYALVGMGTAFAGIIRTPMTSVIMIFEITRDYSIIVPLMISNLIAYFISYRLQPEAIYESLQHQEGIFLPPAASARERVMLVKQAPWIPAETVEATTSVKNVLARINQEKSQLDALPVVRDGILLGLLTERQARQALEEGHANAAIAEILPPDQEEEEAKGVGFPHVYPDDAADTALRRMADAGIHALPVMDRSSIHRVAGIVTQQSIFDAYKVGHPPHTPSAQPAKSASPIGGLLFGLFAATMALMMVIGFLNYRYRTVNSARANDLYESGNELLREGRPADAVQQYRGALSTAPTNEDYRRALGAALVEADSPAEAEIYLSQVLKAHPADGRANLGMARSAAKQGKTSEAQDYYHRAIYGAWPAGLPAQTMRVRFELVDFLGMVGAKTQAVSELLAIVGKAGNDDATLRRAGDLLLKFGAPKQAEDVFDNVLRQNNRDSHALAGVGQAEIALGDYQAAVMPLRNALRWNTNDGATRKRLQVAEEILALDPSAKGLGNQQRYQRSTQILARAVHDLESCVTVDADSLALKPAQKLLTTARQIVASKGTPASVGDAVDHNISLARQLAEQRRTLCSLGGLDDDVLDRVVKSSQPR